MHPNIRHQYPTQQIRQKTHSSSGQPQSLSNHESLMNDKCLEISEDEITLFLLHRFVDEIERALKTVSDKLMEQCKLNNTRVVPKLPENVKLNSVEQPDEDPTESFR